MRKASGKRSRACIELDGLPDGVFIREVVSRELLVDHGDVARGVDVFVREQPTMREMGLQRIEIAGAA